MPTWGVALVALACAVGIAGTIVPVLPGTLVVGAAVLLWAVVEGGWAWAVALAACGVLALGAVLKYLVPGRALSGSGVPWWVLALGGIVGIVGFFVIPVVGLPVGFIGGVFAAEAVRVRDLRLAWPATVAAMKATGLSVLIEMTSAVLATMVWAFGVVAVPG